MKFSNGKCSPRSKISTLLIAREPPAVTASRSSETEVRSSKSSRLRSFQYITSIPSDQVFSECRVPATFWGPATLAATVQPQLAVLLKTGIPLTHWGLHLFSWKLNCRTATCAGRAAIQFSEEKMQTSMSRRVPGILKVSF